MIKEHDTPHDIFGFKVKYINLEEEFDYTDNEHEGSNHNKICQKKGSHLLSDKYYTKEYSVYYAMDLLHNIALLDLFDFKYPLMEIWIDSKTDTIYFASQQYPDFVNIYHQADKKDYAVDIVMTPEQKINYLAALFVIGDLHTENFGVVNGHIVVIDYDEWVMKTTEHFLTWGIYFLYRYAYKDKYVSVKAKELVQAGYKLESIFNNQTKLKKLQEKYQSYYEFCQNTYRYKNINPFEIVRVNALKIAECLKEFSSFKPDYVLKKSDIKKTSLDTKNLKDYTPNNPQYKQEEGFFHYVQKNFHAVFARDFL